MNQLRSRELRAARAAVVAVLLVAGCGHGRTSTLPPPTVTPSPAVTTPGPTPSVSVACTNAQVIRTWSLARQAAEVITVPVLNFDLAGVTSEVQDGAGGVLFLGSRSAPADLSSRVRTLVAKAPTHTRPLVMADEEGGGVQRLAPLVDPVPWARDMARTMTPDAVRALAARVGRQLRAAGVTVDLAPVADVDARPGPSSTNPDGKRSFSGDPATAATYTDAFLKGLRDAGVLPVVKHFPGLGGSAANTDVGPAATRPLSELTTTGLLPFRSAIRAGVPGVMVGNAYVPGLTTLPASLSSAAIGGLLRGQLGFRGLVVTDSLSAGAVRSGGRTLSQAAVAAIAAGADVVLFGSTLTAADRVQLSPANVRRTYDSIVTAISAAIRSGELPRARLVAAAGAVATAARTDLCR